MQFGLVDRVVELDSGRRIVAVKCVTMAEEYLAEHFPDFPVLPGVLMLECMVEAARWLVHEAQDFAHGLVLLESVSGVTYKSFVAPGQSLRVEVTCKELQERSSSFAGVGTCGDRGTVRGRFKLRHSRLAHGPGDRWASERRIIDEARRRWSVMRRLENWVQGEQGSSGQ